MSSKSRLSRSSDDFNVEAEDESFLLDWNNHNFSMTSSFADIRDRQDFVDVTIVAGQADPNVVDEAECDDDFESRQCRSFGAHKVILSACSPYLRHLLRGLSSWQHPVLVFREIPAEDLEAILTFVS
jgi:BTB/POZ domain